MSLLRKCFFIGAMLSVAVWADEISIRNVCDTLPLGAKPKVNLQLAYADETVWHGDKSLKTADSTRTRRVKSYEDIQPLRNDFKYGFPYSITAACSESKFNLYKYGEWDSRAKKWTLNDENDDYATYIMDVHEIKMNGYDSTNTYNFLAMKRGSLPEDKYESGELLASRTFEFQFDWWYVFAMYKTTTVITKEVDGRIDTAYANNYSYISAIGMDSLATVAYVQNVFAVPDSVKKVSLQVIHAVLMDERKIPKDEILFSSSSSAERASSSSIAGNSSSSAVGASSTSVAESSSSSAAGSSSASVAESSSSVMGCSSSMAGSPTAILSQKTSHRLENGPRRVRRLDGTFVTREEHLTPGIYYVKGENGVWKKQMVLPR